MTNEERMEFVREKIQAMWRMNPNSRMSEIDVVRAIVDCWEEDIDETWNRGVNRGMNAD